jgi:hypothetical protein
MHLVVKPAGCFYFAKCTLRVVGNLEGVFFNKEKYCKDYFAGV